MTKPFLLAGALTVAVAGSAAAQTKRPFSLDDLARYHAVSDPQRSPDGKWVAYTVGTTNVEKDKHDRDIWMVSWDGKEQVQLTSSKDNESRPRWSPDGKYLAFLASRGDEDDKKKGRAGVAAQPFRRRGASAHRHQGRHRRVRVVARQQASRADCQRRGPERRAGEDGRLEAQDGAADRDRQIRVQDGRRRLSRQASLAPRRVRHREQEGRRPDARAVRRTQPVVVPRQHEDRLRQRARRRSGSDQQPGHLGDRRQGGRDAAAAHHVPRAGHRHASVESRRQVDRLPSRR